MEETAFLWSYQENVDELNQKLLCTTLELEQLKMESIEETRRTKEYVKQLLQLVELACKERDEARDQLQNLLNKVMSSSDVFARLPSLQPDSPLMKTTNKTNPCITESNSLSDTYNSSPGDSLIDAVSSPDFSNANVGDSSNNQPFVDQASLVIDNIVKGKTLPQKGKLLKAVVDAGPLLQNLLVAGPLPRWRNPPQLETSQIPPVSIKGCDVDVITNANIAPNFSSFASSPYDEMSYFSQMLSTSFGNGLYGSCLGTDRMISDDTNANSYVQVGKRQRFH